MAPAATSSRSKSLGYNSSRSSSVAGFRAIVAGGHGDAFPPAQASRSVQPALLPVGRPADSGCDGVLRTDRVRRLRLGVALRRAQPAAAAGLSGLGALLQGGGFARSQDDTYSVHDFVLSRDALAELDKELGIAQALLRRVDRSRQPIHQPASRTKASSRSTGTTRSTSRSTTTRSRRSPCSPCAPSRRPTLSNDQRLAADDGRAAGQPAERPQPPRPDQRRREGGQVVRGPLQGRPRSRSPDFAAIRRCSILTVRPRCSSRAWPSCRKSCWPPRRSWHSCDRCRQTIRRSHPSQNRQRIAASSHR